MSDCIKCNNCGAVSYYDKNTKIYCISCYDQLRSENEKLKEVLEEIVDYQVWRFKLLPHKNELLEKVVEIAHEALNEVTK